MSMPAGPWKVARADGKVVRLPFADPLPHSEITVMPESAQSALVTGAMLAWQLSFALAWVYPRLWYAMWNGFTTLPTARDADR